MSRFDFLNNSRYEKIYKACVDAERYENTEPTTSASKARIALERVVESLGGNGENLFEKIESLDVPTHIEACFHLVRMIGNKGSHGDDVDANEIEQTLNALHKIVSWMMLESSECQTAGNQSFSHTPVKAIQKETVNTEKSSVVQECHENRESHDLMQNNYETPMEYYRESAYAGDNNAMYRIGFMYEHGQGVAKDYNEAMQWYRTAANAGNIDAKNAIQKLLQKAPKEYVVKNADNIIKIYPTPAKPSESPKHRYERKEQYNNKNVQQTNVSPLQIYLTSEENFEELPCKHEIYTTQQENIKPIKIYPTPAKESEAPQFRYCNQKEEVVLTHKEDDGNEKRCIECLYKNGDMYYNQHNFSEALNSYRQAADRGNNDAKKSLRKLLKDSYIIGEHYYYGKKYEEALKWYHIAADRRSADAMNKLGAMYYKGEGVSQDYNEAITWYRRAANEGNIDALYQLGTIYYKGECVLQNFEKAIEYYRKAATKGNVKAQNAIELLLKEKHKIEEDKFNRILEDTPIQNFYEIGNEYYKKKCFDKAFKCYLKAADNKNMVAMNDIGYMYENGIGVIQNYNEAMKWYTRAAKAGNKVAMEHIGNMYAEGKGVVKNSSQANSWYQKAKNVELKKNSFCYITTAVCSSLHKPDDCYELSAFRAFRDEWLKKQADGAKLIQDYYEIAPVIVNKINLLPNAKDVYHKIWREYLSPCLTMIERGDMGGCKAMYMEMVKNLGDTYNKMISR